MNYSRHRATLINFWTFFQGLRSLLEMVMHFFFQNIRYLMLWGMPLLMATLNVFAKCSRGYIYSLGYFYFRVQSTTLQKKKPACIRFFYIALPLQIKNLPSKIVISRLLMPNWIAFRPQKVVRVFLKAHFQDDALYNLIQFLSSISKDTVKHLEQLNAGR